MKTSAPMSIMNVVMTMIPPTEQQRAVYNLHLSSFDSTFLARISRRDQTSSLFLSLRLLARPLRGFLLLCMTKKSSKSCPNCFRRVTKQSSSIMAHLMMVKGRHRAAKITGNRMAWNLSLDSVKYKLNENVS